MDYMLKKLSRNSKKLLMIFIDFVIVLFSIILSLYLRLGSIEQVIDYSIRDYHLIAIYPFICIIIFYYFNLYSSVIRFMSTNIMWASAKSISLSLLLLSFFMMLFREESFSRHVLLINWFVLLIFIIGVRYLAKWILYSEHLKKTNKKSIAVYGAGEAGSSLIGSLLQSNYHMPFAIFDDDEKKHNTFMHGIKIYSPSKIAEIIARKKIDSIFLAIPSAPRINIKNILESLKDLRIEIKTLPSIDNIIDGKVKIEDIRDVNVDEIIGRDIVKPNNKLLSKNIIDNNVMVTGAGGSIGSELCRQIIRYSPKKLVLVERSEFALYRIYEELKNNEFDIPIVPLLTCVKSYDKMKKNISENNINSIYHAAAYKHVPMVERNPIDGIENNILGTLNIAQAARDLNVSSFVLISTDKAVRPSNIMGASKRFCEIILQAFSNQKSQTVFSMVRFGNVLDSAGSVVPLFREQIKKGGPVTVTHPEVTRFFMSIPEAVQLVIQAGALAEGGDIFLLDMGESVKILDLAKKMIYLSGLEPILDSNQEGDIKIEITGLRPGEKLYEELLIEGNPEQTEHPQILKTFENGIESDKLNNVIAEIKILCEEQNPDGIIKLLKLHIEGYADNINGVV